jgi:TRAP-type C4-dicarboxylate transport system permease small subunit
MSADTGEPRLRGPLNQAIHVLSVIEDWILVLFLAVMIGLAGYQILARNLFESGVSWGDPLLRVLVLWVGLLGAMAATRDENQITIDVLSHILRGRWRTAAKVTTDLFATGVTSLLAYSSLRMVLDEREAGTVAFANVPSWVCELILPFAFAAIAFRYLLYTYRHVNATIQGVEPEVGS